MATTAPAMPAPSPHEKLLRIWETPPGLFGVFATVDHKKIGKRYLATAFALPVAGRAGGGASCGRSSPAPDQHLLTPEAYNQLFSMHGITMIFLVRLADSLRLQQLHLAADARLARHGLPAAERIQLLDVPDVRHLSLLELRSSGRRRTAAGSPTRR